MRSEEWWKGRTIHKAPHTPLFYIFLILMFHVKHKKPSPVGKVVP